MTRKIYQRHFDFLRWLADNCGLTFAIPAKEIAKRFGCSIPSVSSYMLRLEQFGYLSLERHRCPVRVTIFEEKLREEFGEV